MQTKEARQVAAGDMVQLWSRCRCVDEMAHVDAVEFDGGWIRISGETLDGSYAAETMKPDTLVVVL